MPNTLDWTPFGLAAGPIIGLIWRALRVMQRQHAQHMKVMDKFTSLLAEVADAERKELDEQKRVVKAIEALLARTDISHTNIAAPLANVDPGAA